MQRNAAEYNCRRGFTIVELLVVVAVIGLLIGLVATIGSSAIHSQRAANTRQIMQLTTLAIEQFATEQPLRAFYNVKGEEGFGPYPPYQVAGTYNDNQSVRHIIERDPAVLGYAPRSLAERLYRDLDPHREYPQDQWMRFSEMRGDAADVAGRADDGHDDARALYIYLKIFSPGVLDIIPEDRIKPIYGATADPGWVYLKPGDDTQRFDVRVIHDAWDVPLDYMLYLKCEWSLAYGGTQPQFNATARMPALRSRGIDRETFDAITAQASGNLSLYADQEIFSVELPKPYATLGASGGQWDGVLDKGLDPRSDANGWLRAVAAMGDDVTAREDYDYRPDEP